MSNDKIRVTGPAIERLEGLNDDETPEGRISQIRGEEQLYGAFRYAVRYEYSPDSPSNVGEVINREVRLHFHQEMNDDKRGRHSGTRTLYGIVTKVRQHGRGANGQGPKTNDTDSGGDSAGLNVTSYLLEIRPALWRLHLSRTSRTFGDCPVVSTSDDSGVLNQVVEKYNGLTLVTDALKESYPNQKTIRQRDETDLQFVNRLTEKHGIVYYVPNQTTVHTRTEGKGNEVNGDIRLVDDDAAYESYWRCSRRSGTPVSTLRAVASENDNKKEGTLNSYSYEQNLTSARLTAVATDFDSGRVRTEWTEAATEEAKDAAGTVWEPGGITGYSEHSPKEAWGQFADQGSPNVGEMKGSQLQAGKEVLRGHTHSRLLGAGMTFGLDEKTCGDVLTHFDGERQPTFVVRRLLVSTNPRQTGRHKGGAGDSREPTLSTRLNVEFEAFPVSESRTYRGDRYVDRGTTSGDAEGGATHERNRFNVLAAKYSSLRDSVKALAVAVLKGSDTLKKSQIKDLKNLPARARGLEAIDPYELTLDPTAGPSSSSPRPERRTPELCTAVVTEVPAGGEEPSAEAEQGQVKVRIDHDSNGESDTREVWARVLTFWAGNRWGAQFLPRQDARVLVANPGRGDDQFYVVGSLFGGTETMPHPEAPEKSSGIRGRSSRTNVGEGKDQTVHNEILLKDEAKEEEIRVMAPTYRTDVTGAGKDMSDEKRKYYKIKIRKFKKLSEEDIYPTPNKYITKRKKKSLKSKYDSGLCLLKPWIEEVKEETNLSVKNEKEKMSLNEWRKRDKKSKLKKKKSLPNELSKKIKDKTDIESYLRMPKNVKLRRKNINDKYLSVINGWDSGADIGETGLQEKVDAQKWAKMDKEVKFTVAYPGTGGYEGSGFENLKKEVKSKYKKNENLSWTEGKWGIYIDKNGKDVYRKSDIKPFKNAYSSIVLGRDAFSVSPFKELYPKSIEEEALFHGDWARAEYTEGGVLEACQGTYEIHTFGDRIEICRGGETSEDVFDQQATEEWTIDDLPGELERYRSEKNNPILILSKDGAIEIQSKKGINIESGGDINIQSGGDISMYAEKRIFEESGIKHNIESKDISIEGDMHKGKIDIVSHEIEIGVYPTTKEIKLEGGAVEKHSNHHYETRTGIKVKKENYVASLAKIHDNATAMHNIQAVMGTKSALIETASVLLGNKNVVLDMKNAVLDIKNAAIDNATKAVDVKTEPVKADTGGVVSKLKALSSYA
jgi:uncharacterized protein involved in type VI secretion and phage assembly